MAVVVYGECHGQTSTKAKRCPHCRARIETVSTRVVFWLVVFTTVFAVAATINGVGL